MPKREPLHKRVNDALTAAGVSHAEIVKKTGWSEMRVWRLMTGRTEFKADDMVELAKLAHVSVAELYGEAA